MRIEVIITVMKAIWVVLVIYQSILKYNEKNIETHFTYEDGESDYGHMDDTHLGMLFSLLNQMEALITSLVMKVLKK